MDWRDSADRIEPALANEPTERMQPNEATDPIDSIDPAEPMLKIEPEEPIDRIDPLDPMLRIEPPEPADRRELPVIPMPGFSHPGTAGRVSAVHLADSVRRPSGRAERAARQNVHRMEKR
jgi:hypothetical protein